MELFLDTANIEEIKEAASWGVISGITTNPSLCAKESGKPFEEIAKEILAAVDGPISLEAVSMDAVGICKEAHNLCKLHKNVVVKVPLTPEGLKAVSQLSKEGIKTNVTLIFSASQALLAARAGATYVSPFVGRLDDIGKDGMDLVEEIVVIFKNYSIKTKVLVASVRNIEHVRRAARLGADIATIPFRILEEMTQHPLTDKGIKKFLEDWNKVKEAGK